MRNRLFTVPFAPNKFCFFRRVLLLFLAVSGFTVTTAQMLDTGNGWYDASEDYIAVKVWEDGVYRISAADFAASGISLSGTNPDNLHLMYRGVEQPVYVQKTGSALEYVEFIGHRADGRADTALYSAPWAGYANNRSDLSPNLNINLFSDTSVYYLWFDNQPGLRTTIYNNTNYSAYSPVSSFLTASQLEFHPDSSFYLTGSGAQFDIYFQLNPEYTPGQGFVGPLFSSPGLQRRVDIPTPGRVGGTGIPLQMQARVMGVSNWNHDIEVTSGGTTVMTGTSTGAGVILLDSIVTNLPAGDSLPLTFAAYGTQTADNNFLTYVAVEYYREPGLNGENTVLFLQETAGTSRFRFLDAAVTDSAWAWNLQSATRMPVRVSNDTLDLLTPATAAGQPFMLFTDDAIRTPLIHANPPLNNLSDPGRGTDLVIITDRKLSVSANAYKNFRAASTMHAVSGQVVFTDEIYAEFGFGTTSTLAIKRFLLHAANAWNNPPKYVLIWGDGHYLTRNEPDNYVPTYGFPVSDWMFVNNPRLDTLDYSPQAAIGRVPVQSDAEGMDYLAKMQAYESLPWQSWMRNGLFLGGGLDSVTQIPIQHYQQTMMDTFENGIFNGVAFSHQLDGNDTLSNTSLSVPEIINQGVNMVNHIGPSSAFVLDFNLESPDSFANDSLPFLFFGLNCFTTDFTNTSNGAGERWVNAPGKGAIAWIAPSCEAYLTPSAQYGQVFMARTFYEQPGSPLGDKLRETIIRYIQPQPNRLSFNHSAFINLLGDPSMRTHSPTHEVWPGDANYDLTADVFDLLPIGVANGTSGITRPGASLTWQAQPSPDWGQTQANSANYNHIDCDGNGSISLADTLAINLNYGLSHAKRHESNKVTGAPELFLSHSTDSLQAGDSLLIEVHLGTSTTQADSVYGVAFSILYDPNLIDSADITISFDSCWLGTPGVDVATMSRILPNVGRIDIGLTRYDGQSISGFGIIGGIGIVVIDNISGKDILQNEWSGLDFRARQMVGRTGEELPLNAEGTDFYLERVPAETLPEVLPPLTIDVYPNPSQGRVSVELSRATDGNWFLTDLQGRRIGGGSIAATTYFTTWFPELSPGMYILTVQDATGQAVEKIEIVK